MTDEMVAFIRKQLDADAAEAERLGGEEWAWCFSMPSDGEPHGRISVITESYCVFEQATRRMSHPDNPIAVLPKDDADKYGDRMLHITRHDPERVLREVAAKRAIINDYAETCRIRDEAAERIRAAGDNPDSADLDEWARAHTEAGILLNPISHLAAVYADRDGYKEEWAS